MRIAFFSDNFYPELSGISDSILITGKELVKRGHSVVYVAPEYLPEHYTLVGKNKTIENGLEYMDGLPIIRLPSVHLPFSPTGQSRFAFPSGKAVDFLREWKPDIIHTQSPYGVGFEAKKTAKQLGVPLVGTNHSPIEEFYPWIPQIMRRFDAWYYNHCAYVTTPFEKLITRMREAGFNQPAQALPNPVQAFFTPPSAGEKVKIRQSLGLVGPVILYSGRLDAVKHVDVTLRSIAKLKPLFPPITFVLTGHGSSERSLQELARTLGITENVLFAGFVDPEKLKFYYKASDVFVIMSTADSQSLSLMQAYATGIPSIGARAHGLPDYIPSDCGFLLEPGDVEGLTQKLSELFQDESLREKMGTAGMKFIEKMSPEKIAAQWEDIYQKAVDGK